MTDGRRQAFRRLGLVCAAAAVVALSARISASGLQRVGSGQNSVKAVVTISGVALSRIDRQPLARVAVNVSSSDGSVSMSATDELGRFSVVVPRAPAYRLRASRSGYVLASVSGTPLSDGVQLDVDPGGVRFVELWFAVPATIVGRVLDPDGQPVEGAAVHVLRPQVIDGLRRVAPISVTQSDDRGHYRVARLTPGRYTVRAQVIRPIVGSSKTPSSDRGNGNGRRNEGEESDLVPTYYPSTMYVGEAQSLNLTLDQQVENADITLVRTPVARLEGYVSAPDGSATGSGVVSLTPESSIERAQVGVTYSSQIRGDGFFAIAGVPVGSYVLIARSGGAAALSAREFVSLNERLTTIRVWMADSATITGRLVLGRDSPPPDLRRVRIGLIPLESQVGTLPVSTIHSDGTFVISNISPGPALFRVFSDADSLALESIIARGRDVADRPIDIEPADRITGVLIRFADQLTEITGSVSSQKGSEASAVIAVPVDKALRDPGSRRIAVAHLDRDGRYAMRRLPPGDYYLLPVAGTDIASVAAELDDIEDTLASTVRISIHTGIPVTQDLTYAPR